MLVKARIQQLLQQLNTRLYEKEKIMGLSLLSAIAGESIFLIGPPGVAKSLMARRLKHAFHQSKSFEYLMGKFSTPDEIFGPVSISKLKDEDKYERLTDNYLPGANIVFLDEIWKASPAIQNALLTVLNEKKYRNGEKEIKVNIQGLIAASNELPLQGEGLEALWDRFLIRHMVENIQDEILFNQMLVLNKRSSLKDVIEDGLKIKTEEYQSWAAYIDQIDVPPHILGLINHIRKTIAQRNASLEGEDHIYVSDRRWKKIVNLLRASAFLNDRQAVNVMDSFVIADCIWQHTSQIREIADLVKGSIVSYGYKQLIHIESIQKELDSLQEEILKETQIVSIEKVKVVKVFKDQAEQEFVQIHNFWSEGNAFIRKADLVKFNNDQEAYIPVFEKTSRSFRPFQTYAFKRLDEFTFASKGKELKLETVEQDKEIIKPKVPSSVTTQIWDQRISLLLAQIDQDLKILGQRKSEDLAEAMDHLFINADHAKLIEESLKSSEHDIINLRLEIEKTQHQYAKIGQD